MIMIKYLLIFLLLNSNLFADDHGIHDESGLETEQTLRLFYKKNETRYIFEYHRAQRLEDQNLQQFTLGFKHRVLDNLKIGLYYTKALGERYEEDWIKPPGEKWKWFNSNHRDENHFTLELSPRYMFNSRMVGEFRIRYVYNDFNFNQTLKLRPGLTYFLFDQGKPWINLYSHLEVYQSLNFSRNDIYESWLYFGAQYFVSKTFLVGPYLATRHTRWASTSVQESIDPDQYNSRLNGYILGLAANFYY